MGMKARSGFFKGTRGNPVAGDAVFKSHPTDYFDYISGSGKRTRQFNFVIIPEDCSQVVLTEHDSYKWQTPLQALENPKITDEVKTCIQIFNANEIYKNNLSS